MPKLRYQMRGATHPKHRTKGTKAAKRLKSIAGRLVRELERKLNPTQMGNFIGEIEIFKKVLAKKEQIRIKFILYMSQK